MASYGRANQAQHICALLDMHPGNRRAFDDESDIQRYAQQSSVSALELSTIRLIPIHHHNIAVAWCLSTSAAAHYFRKSMWLHDDRASTTESVRATHYLCLIKGKGLRGGASSWLSQDSQMVSSPRAWGKKSARRCGVSLRLYPMVFL